MKTLKNYLAIAAIVFATASCVENSEKYKSAIAERDSIKLENQALGSNYNQTLDIINEVETGFAQISESEGQMKLDIKMREGKMASRKERITAQMNSIKEIMAKNKAKIAELQRLSGKKGKENKTLTQTIKRLQDELAEKTALIQSLQDELAQKNIKIDELNNTVNGLNSNVAELNNANEQQKSTIKTQDENLNSAWYCVAPSSKLKSAKILSGTGLFQRKRVLDNDFDINAFTKADLRTLSSIPTDSKKAKILSLHPANSYNLVRDANEKVTIEITNAAKFWSVSKYLVVQI